MWRQSGVQPANSRSFRTGPDGRNLAAAATGRLVSACRKSPSLTGEKIMPTPIDVLFGAQDAHESRPCRAVWLTAICGAILDVSLAMVF